MSNETESTPIQFIRDATVKYRGNLYVWRDNNTLSITDFNATTKLIGDLERFVARLKRIEADRARDEANAELKALSPRKSKATQSA